MRLRWDGIIVKAAEIVQSYDTGVTLRQLFYRLVAIEVIPNTKAAYGRLSWLTARARRDGWFPPLIDNTRTIRVAPWWDGADEMMEQTIKQYRRDRTEHQEYSVYVAVEKNALAALITSWYWRRGIPVLAFGGYPSQTFVEAIKDDIDSQNRPAVLIYGGDFDATGVDILRDFAKRTMGYWEHQDRIALNEDQIEEYQLPPLPGKSWDPRAESFIATYGELVQVELDALPPDVLRKIYDEAVDSFWDEKGWEKSVEQEDEERKRLIMPDDVGALVSELRYIVENSHPDDQDVIDVGHLLDKYEGIF